MYTQTSCDVKTCVWIERRMALTYIHKSKSKLIIQHWDFIYNIDNYKSLGDTPTSQHNTELNKRTPTISCSKLKLVDKLVLGSTLMDLPCMSTASCITMPILYDRSQQCTKCSPILLQTTIDSNLLQDMSLTITSDIEKM